MCVVTDRVELYACTVQNTLATEVGSDRASRTPIDTTDSCEMLLCIHRGVCTRDEPRASRSHTAGRMSASDEVRKATDYLANGHPRRALSVAWRAADTSLREGDAEALRAIMAICEALHEDPDKRVASDARQLSSYCRHTLDGAGGGVESHTIIARISRMREPKRVCPDCAEKVLRRARVCRFCGYRFADPAEPSE